LGCTNHTPLPTNSRPFPINGVLDRQIAQKAPKHAKIAMFQAKTPLIGREREQTGNGVCFRWVKSLYENWAHHCETKIYCQSHDLGVAAVRVIVGRPGLCHAALVHVLSILPVLTVSLCSFTIPEGPTCRARLNLVLDPAAHGMGAPKGKGIG